MTDEKENLNIKSSVDGLIKTQISAAILEQMGGMERVIDTLIAKVLTEKKYDRHGGHSSYSTNKEYSFLEVQLFSNLEEQIKRLLGEVILEHTELIKDNLKKAMLANIENFTQQVVDSLTKNANSDFNTSVKITLPRHSDD